MTDQLSKFSAFSQPADRGTSSAYFLGAVVPLVVLGVVIDRYVLSALTGAGDGLEVLGHGWVLWLFGSLSLMSLSCFFLLRQLVRASIAANRKLAQYDGLTGLPNRLLYRERLEQALIHAERSSGMVAICFLDLDGFKRINDSFGHSSGDRLLVQVAKRVIDVVRVGDAVARSRTDPGQTSVSRLGGDEFTVLLTGISSAQDAGRVARRILEALREPFELDRHEVFATASIGIAVSPLDGVTAGTLLKNADTAMYAAKESGRDNYRYYDQSMNDEAETRLVLECRLRHALDRGELSVHYQPVRNLSSGIVSGAEALVRWHVPGTGLVPPDEFIPIAEDAGLICRIGAWVLRTACDQAQAWQEAGYRPIRMAVNVSGRQIRQPEFAENVRVVLEESGLSSQCLELEITESTIMRNDEVTDATFRALNELGVGIALDDFGTGYSSLSYLRRFPVSRVKIDRSFVADIPGDADDMAMAAAIVAMAHCLLLPVVGEGVETEEQAQSLRELGCEEVQGFLLSPAVPAAEFVRFLDREKPE